MQVIKRDDSTGVKAPDIPMVKDEQELKNETDETIRKIWDNF